MSSTPSAEPEPTGAGSEPTRTERIFARMALAQTVTAVIAVVISCAALYATWVQAQSARTQTEAQVWPRIISFTNRSDNEAGEPVFDITLANRGVGPAEVRSMRLRHDGETIRDYQDLLTRLPEGVRSASLRHGYINGRIIAPGEDAVLIGVTGQEMFEALLALLENADLELCYCSLLDQCWVLGGADQGMVSQCPDYGGDEFGN